MNNLEAKGTSEDLSQWAKSVSILPKDEFLHELMELKDYEWQRVDDLAPVLPVLDRINGLLQDSLSTHDLDLLGILLDKTQILLKPATSKALYNSIDSLIFILDFSEWDLVYKALQVLYLVANRINPTMKSTKAHRNHKLTHKLYVIGLGSQLHNNTSIPLQTLCSDEEIPSFQIQEELIGTNETPEDLKYIILNRKRINASLHSFHDRQLIVSCQLLALSIFLQVSPDFHMLQEFNRSLPELWLLPAISELLRMPASPQVHIQAIHLLSAVLVMLEGQPSRHEVTQNQLITATHNLLAAWQQHGLMQSLLRDIVYPIPALIITETARSSDFIDGVLHLASIFADYKYRVDSSHVPGMIVSLLLMLKMPENNTYRYSLTSMAKATRILTVLISHSIDMFRELDGLDTVLQLTNNEIELLTSPQDCFYSFTADIIPTETTRAALLRPLLRVIKIVLTKAEPGAAQEEVREILEAGLIKSLKKLFEKQRFDLYEPAIQILNTIIGEVPIVAEWIADGTLVAFFNSLETTLPPNSKLMGVITRFLCQISLQAEGVQLIERFSTISRILQALGSIDTSVLSNDVAVGIGESLQELMTIVPGIRDKAVEGCIQLIYNLRSCDLSAKESFFTQLTNIGRLLAMLFNYSTDLIRGFLDNGGLEEFLGLFRLPILPLTYSNEFHTVLTCFKSIPVNLTPIVLGKVLEALNQQLGKMEDIIGDLKTLSDISHVTDDLKTQFMFILTATDSYVEMTRLVLQYGTGVTNNINELCNTLNRLSYYMRLLIAEQARLSAFSKSNEKFTNKFNMLIDIQNIENAEMKSYEENFYFTCQLSVRRLFRFATRIPSTRGRQSVSEEVGVKISRVMGDILADLTSLLNLNNTDQAQAYYFCLQFSDILKILLHEQGSSPSTLWAFSQAGGLENIFKFVYQLKEISFKLYREEKLPYDLVNSLQILWNLSGKALEGLVSGKYAGSGGSAVLKALNIDGPKEVVKKMQNSVFTCIKNLNFLECGIVSNAFAKSVLEVLKQLSDMSKEQAPQVDNSTTTQLVEMGFPENVARQALLHTGASSIELAMEWIFNHPEANDLAPPPPKEESPTISINFEHLHQMLINSLPAIPSMSASVGEILLKICNKADAPHADIAFMLLSLVGNVANEKLKVGSLKDVTEGMTNLELFEIPATFEQFSASLQVLSVLSSKSADILEIIKGNNFCEHAVNFLQKLCDEPEISEENYHWIGYLFSIADILVKFGETGKAELTFTLARFVKVNKEKGPILDQNEVVLLIQLLTSLTANIECAKIFLDEGGLLPLLTFTISKPEPRGKALLTSYFNLVKQLSEDPYILQATFEIAIQQALNGTPQLDVFLKNFKSQANRSKEIFQHAMDNMCVIMKKEKTVVVKLKKDRKDITAEKWKTIEILSTALSEAYEDEQIGKSDMILGTEHIVSLMADIIQCYPILIKNLFDLTLTASDPLCAEKTSKPFLTHLVRNFIPFRYTLQLTETRIIFNQPGTNQSISPETYQSWIKTTTKLLKVLTFKQTHRHPNTPVADLHNLLLLENNNSILKARKRIFRELRDMFTEQVKKPWFENEKSMSIVRTVSITIMQLLRESSKSPFVTTNPAEIAKLLVSDQISMVRLLSETVKKVDLNFRKAASILNLILAPLELLTRYNINFILHLSKPSQELDEAAEELPQQDENYPIEENNSVSSGENEGNEEIEIEIEEEEEEEEEDEEELVEDESDHIEEEEALDGMVLESHNTEAFWADDFVEDEEIEPGRQWGPGIAGRREDHNRGERHILENAFQQEAEDGSAIYQPREARGLLREFEDPTQIMQLLRDFDSSNEEFIQVLLNRNRAQPREAPIERNPPRLVPELDTVVLDELAQEFSTNAEEFIAEMESLSSPEESKEELSIGHEEIVIPPMHLDESIPEEIKQGEPSIPALIIGENVNPIEIIPHEEQKSPEPHIEEEAKAAIPNGEAPSDPSAVPEGIDPAFLEALPEDIRSEILAQYRAPPARQNNANADDDFLDALPPDLRAEVMQQQRAANRPPEEMDNAAFVASLAPDLRREVLLTATDEFLASLPPEFIAEARMLQERVRQHRQNFMMERNQAQQHRPPSLEEGKAISEVVADDKLANSLIQVEDSFLEVLLKCLYIANPVNRDIFASLMLNLSAQQPNRHKMLDGLISLLLQITPRDDFPPRQLYGSDSLIENYNQVYAVVSGRILDILQHLAKMNPKVSLDLSSSSKFRLPLIKSIRGNDDIRGFHSLIELVEQQLFRTSSSHLTPLINLILAIVDKQGTNVQKIDQFAISQLCSLLSYKSLNEATVKVVVDLVTKLAQNEENRVHIEQALNTEVKVLGEEIAESLKRNETSRTGIKELQLLRLCTVLRSVSGKSEGLEGLWGPLTDVLNSITTLESDLESTTNPTLSKLLPVIETFFIYHMDGSRGEAFQTFCDKNRKFINLLVKQNPSLLNDTFHSLITRFPSLLDFENKRNYFLAEIRKLRLEQGYESIKLHVRRAHVFIDSFHQLKVRNPNEMYGKLRVQFIGEEGLDAGGLTREWYTLLAREMFNPNYALFIPSANAVAFQPNSMSYINSEHLDFFNFVGRIIGKAICDGYSLDLYFTRSFYKHILGQQVNYQDMEDLDPDFYKSLKYLLGINLNDSDLHEYYFALEEEEFGKLEVKELIPGGKTIRVTEANKMEYIKLLCHMKMTKNILKQINAFLEGFYEIVPKQLISIFDSKELELLISGLPEIDIEDFKANTEYHNYTKTTPVIVWFWEVLEEFSHEERAEFLQFVTGSSKVPLEGFKSLPGMGGIQLFQIHKSFTDTDRLPTAHTCMNQLDLPEYPSKEILRSKLKLACSEGKEGFGFI
ncbi:unnamed protein product [Blepharisma stoltei]|uniref:HECT-type E3 ubiquitin transferase n=1 Tax=Blepharisma stoltei TaxID=1481888 RepID=A0AAU9K748_9CILI|nr:unnamed protein product [Blepharisma stoltei]